MRTGVWGLNDMLNLLLYGLILVFSTSLFEFTYAYSGVSRSFTSLGKGATEISAITKDEAGDWLPTPYLDETIFKEKTEEHFTSSLKRYLSFGQKPTFSYVFFTKGVTLEEGKHNACSFSFSCPVSIFMTYQNKVTFSLQKGALNA
jgi:hypothetical protein